MWLSTPCKHQPLFCLAIALMLGVIVQIHYALSVRWIAVVFFVGMVSVAAVPIQWIRNSLILILSGCVGMGLVVNALSKSSDDISFKARFVRGKSVLIRGKIVSEPRVQESAFARKYVFTMKIKDLKDWERWVDQSGLVLVQDFGSRRWRNGDEIVVEGKLHRAFESEDGGNFSYRDFLHYQGIDFVVSVSKNSFVRLEKPALDNAWFSRISFIREWCRTVFDQWLSPSESGIIKAMVIGDRSGIPRHIRDLFERTGTVHILAISGLHMGMIAFMIILLLGCLHIPRRWIYLLSISVLMLYACLAGGRVSVIRSVIMVSVLLSAFVFERRHDGLNALGFAALLIVGNNPLVIFQIGFQLSFLSVFSILWMMPIWSQVMTEWKSWRFFQDGLGVSLAAGVATGGLVSYYFGLITPVGFVANLFIVPLLSIILALSFLLLLCGAIAPWLAVGIAMCVKILLNLMAFCAYIFAQIPFGFIRYSLNFQQVMIYYTIFILLLLIVNLKNTIFINTPR